MTEIITYIQANWVAWLFAIIGAVLGYIIKKMLGSKEFVKTI